MILAPADESRDGSSIPETPFATLRGRRHCPATDAQRLVLFCYPLEKPQSRQFKAFRLETAERATTGSIWDSITG